MRLESKVALITGGYGGMGRASARLFAKEGAAVVITGRDEDRGNALVKEITDDGGTAIFAELEVTDQDQWTAAAARAKETFGALHILMNIVGSNELVMFPEVDIDQWNKIRGDRWPIQISCYLKKPEDIHTYVDTPQVPPGNSFCYQQWTRMDITPEGDVTPCILYPDLKVGNLRDQGALAVWNSPAFAAFRRLRRREVLPVCAKCNAIYLHDSKRKHL